MSIRTRVVNMIPVAILYIGTFSAANAAGTYLGNARQTGTIQPILMADSTQTTSSVTENGVTTTTRSVTTSINPICSDALASVLNARRYELDKMIGDGMMSHAINADTAVRLQSELNQVTSDWVAAKSAPQTMTMNQAVAIARELDVLNSNVAAALGVNPLSRLTVSQTTDGSTQIVIDQFGKVIGLNSASPDIYIGTLNARRLQLENTISIGLAAGSISQDQANDMRADLERVARAQSESSPTKFSYVNALPLAVSLDSVGNQLKTVVRTVNFDPLINGNRFVVSGGAVIMLDDVMVRRAGLESRIAHEFEMGRISADQAGALRDQLSRVADLESQMRTKGGLTFEDGRILYARFDRVGTRLDGYVADSRRSPISSGY